MSTAHMRPSEIERTSLSIISRELDGMGIVLPEEQKPLVLRVIHATADFDYASNLVFTENAVRKGIAALAGGADIVTDTNMAKAGISKNGLAGLGGGVFCYMADPEIAERARLEETTRAAVSMRHAVKKNPGAVFAVGNAPTALLELERQLETGFRPALIIGVPVGFVNVLEAKERIISACERFRVPAIVARGRKGGSSVAAAIANALIYSAADMLEPERRGWN
ncbi:MAG: precorrin-8X methylmutase [Lachnospiraceae bacterium]|nr:precorrin-8X methylmutase [Lachnospiraceae bacterium]